MSIINNKYNMIVAADNNWCIGKNGKLLDHFSEDMKYFKNITSNKVVIMGKKTQESLPNKYYLKNRINLVLTDNDSDFKQGSNYLDDNTALLYLRDIVYIPDLIKCINYNHIEHGKYSNFSYITDGDVFVIGGGQTYRQFLENDLIDTVYLTKINHVYDGDTFIPNLWDLGFKIIDKLIPTATNENGISYDILVLKK